MSATDPFRSFPPALARLPRLVRLYIFNCMIGFMLAGCFTGLILWFNVANIGYLVTHVAGGWLAALVFFVLNGIVFSGVQTGIVIMSMDYPGEPKDKGGHRQGHQREVRPPFDPLPARATPPAPKGADGTRHPDGWR
ncbi:MAG: hypothetical protein AAF922_09405 [Pseudomonadota bacterium]